MWFLDSKPIDRITLFVGGKLWTTWFLDSNAGKPYHPFSESPRGCGSMIADRSNHSLRFRKALDDMVP